MANLSVFDNRSYVLSNLELLNRILLNLSLQELAVCSLVTKIWHQVISHDEFWKLLSYRDFQAALEAFPTNQDTNYRKLYMNFYTFHYHGVAPIFVSHLITQNDKKSVLDAFKNNPVPLLTYAILRSKNLHTSPFEMAKKEIPHRKRQRTENDLELASTDRIRKKQKTTHDPDINDCRLTFDSHSEDISEEGSITAISPEEKVIDAIKKGKAQELRTLISCLPDGVNTQLEDGATFLLYAIDSHSVPCAENLLKMGAKIEDHEREYTPLFTAAENGDLAMVKLILKYGANLTGEFYFNKETSLSVAGFKFCDIFQHFLKANFHFFPNELQEAAKELLDIWVEDQQWVNDNKLPGLWIYFGQKEFQEYANCCLKAFRILKQEALNNGAKLYLLDKISPRAEIFELIKKKYQIIEEKAPSVEEDNYGTDEDEDLELIYKIEPAIPPVKEFQNLARSEVKIWVDRLNQELKEGKTELEIDWAKYPRFFIVQYRGIHYYRHYFSKNQRADHRATFHLNRIAPAGTTYFMADANPTKHQLARESVLASHRQTIVNTFKQLSQTGPIQAYWDKKRVKFRNASDMMQQRMSNSYDGYMKDIVNPQNSTTKLLHEKNIKKGYPHYATSDLPRDALKYTFGQKPIKSLKEWRLRPVFQENGKALHPYPGKIFMTIFTPLQMYLHDTNHVAGKHNRKHVSLTKYVAPERETNMPGGVKPEVSFYEELVIIPSFETYSEDYKEKYNISSDDFKGYKERIRLSWVHSNKNERDNLRKAVKNEIIEKIIEHKEEQLLKIAQQEAKQRGGYLIFCHTDGRYGIDFEKIRLPSKKALSYTPREIAIIENLTKIDEISRDTPSVKDETSKFSETASEQEDEEKLNTEQFEIYLPHLSGFGYAAASSSSSSSSSTLSLIPEIAVSDDMFEDDLPIDLPIFEKKIPIKSGSSSHGVERSEFTIAERLWKNPTALITKEMVEKVNKVTIYLKEQGFELCGVPADGDCFLHAFLGSYQTLNKKIPLIDEQMEKVKYLREWIASKFLEKHPKNSKRAQEIKRKQVWINSNEGDLLASIFTDIPIRIVTVEIGKEGDGISDMVTRRGSQGLERAEWKKFQDNDYQEHIFIVDLGGHFLYAKKC